MAANGKRDVELRVGVTTEGADRIRALGNEVNNLAKEGAAASQDFSKLTTEVEKLGKQQGAVDALNRIETEVEQTRVALEGAERAVKETGDAFDAQTASTNAFREAEQALQKTLQATQTEISELVKAQRNLKAGNTDLEKGSAAYRAEVDRLKKTIAELRNSEDDQTRALRDATAARKTAEQALREQGVANINAANAARQLRDALEGQATEMMQAVGAMQQLGIAAEDAGKAQKQVDDALLNTARAAKDAAQQLSQQAAAQERAEASTKALALAQQFLDTELELVAAQGAYAVKVTNEETAAAERLARASRESAEALRQQAAASKAALDTAFSTTGVRSAQQINAEINKIRESLSLLQTQGLSKLEMDRAFASAQQRVGELRQELVRVPGAFDLVGSSVSLLKNQFIQLAAAYQGIDLVSKFIEANNQIEGLRRTLTLTTGSVAEAERQIRFLRDAANLTGQSFSALTDDYKRFQVALSTSGYSAKETESIFLAVASAAGKIGLSTEKVNNILNALGQIANKGKVSMEELRGQLGESLPGAMKIAADAVGLPVDRLTHLIETGQVLSRDLLPYLPQAFAKAFGDSQQKVEGFQASWNRLKNAITESVQQASETQAWKLLTQAVGFTADNFKVLSTTVIDFGKVIGAVKLLEYLQNMRNVSAATKSATLDQVANTEATVANSAAKTNAARVETEVAVARRAATVATAASTTALVADTTATTANSAAKLNLARSASGLVPTFSSAAASATSFGGAVLGVVGKIGAYGLAAKLMYDVTVDVGKAIGEGIANLQGYGKQIADNEAKLRKSEEELNRQLTQSGETILQLVNQYDLLNKKTADAVSVAEKSAKAREVEGNALLAVSRLFDDATRIRQTESEVAQTNLEALSRVATARSAEAQGLIDYAAKLKEAATASRDVSSATKERIEKATQAAEVAKAAAERAVAEADAQKTLADATRQAAEATKDNSGRVDELRIAYENAAVKLQIVAGLVKEGVLNQQQLTAATRDAALSEGAYKDALGDTARNIQLKIDAARADYETARVGLTVRQQEAQASEKVAQAYGREAEATDAKVRQKRIEIEQIRLSTSAKIEEANRTIAQLKLQRDEITGTDDISEAKRKEIDIRIKNQEAKIAEAKGSEAVVRGINAEIEAIQRRAVAQTAGNAGPSNDLGLDANGRTEYQRNLMSQQGGPVDNSYIFSLRDRLNRGDSFAASELPAIENALRVAKDNARLGAAGSVSLEGRADDAMWINILQRVRDRVASPAMNGTGITGGFSSGGSSGGYGGTPLFTDSPASTPASGSGGGSTSHTVTINFGGQQQTINTASSSDAITLVNILKSLQNGAARTGP